MDYEQELPGRKRSVTLVSRPHSAQTRVAVGIRTIPRSDERFLALRVANQVLGGGASSRLFINLREDKGYTYGAYSILRSHHQGGFQAASASVKTETTAASVEEILKEIDKMSSRVPSSDELKRSKAELAGSFIRRTEIPVSVGALEVSKRLMNLPDDYYQTYIPNLQSFTGEELQTVSQQLLIASEMSIVVVSDCEAVEKDLRSFGSLRIVDPDGNPLK
jgi:predicted Zn-dependent peptidase